MTATLARLRPEEPTQTHDLIAEAEATLAGVIAKAESTYVAHVEAMLAEHESTAACEHHRVGVRNVARIEAERVKGVLLTLRAITERSPR